MIKLNKNHLLLNGWAAIEKAGSFNNVVENIIKELKIEGDVFTDEIPGKQGNPDPFTYTGIFNIDGFPYHTDFAFHKRAPRYVLLQCNNKGDLKWPTIICKPSLHSLTISERELLSSEPWYFGVMGNRHKSCLLGMDSHTQENIIRFDPPFMHPSISTRSKSLAIFEKSIENGTSTKINWENGKTIIFDNWRVVHARGAPTSYKLKNKYRNTRTLSRAFFYIY